MLIIIFLLLLLENGVEVSLLITVDIILVGFIKNFIFHLALIVCVSQRYAMNNRVFDILAFNLIWEEGYSIFEFNRFILAVVVSNFPIFSFAQMVKVELLSFIFNFRFVPPRSGHGIWNVDIMKNFLVRFCYYRLCFYHLLHLFRIFHYYVLVHCWYCLVQTSYIALIIEVDVQEKSSSRMGFWGSQEAFYHHVI